MVRRVERRSSAGIRRGKAARGRRAAALRRAAVPVSSRSCAPMAGDIRGTRAAAAGALHVTVAAMRSTDRLSVCGSLRRLCAVPLQRRTPMKRIRNGYSRLDGLTGLMESATRNGREDSVDSSRCDGRCSWRGRRARPRGPAFADPYLELALDAEEASRGGRWCRDPLSASPRRPDSCPRVARAASSSVATGSQGASTCPRFSWLADRTRSAFLRDRRRRMAPSRRMMTIERWRRLRRSTAPTQRDPWSRLLAAARRVARHGEQAAATTCTTPSAATTTPPNGSSCCSPARSARPRR